jgi:hypothetical protein
VTKRANCVNLRASHFISGPEIEFRGPGDYEPARCALDGRFDNIYGTHSGTFKVVNTYICAYVVGLIIRTEKPRTATLNISQESATVR